MQKSPPSTSIPSPPTTTANTIRPDRPCDNCRRRKTRCVLNSSNDNTCVLCAFHSQTCTFLEDAAPRRRKVRALSSTDTGGNGNGGLPRRTIGGGNDSSQRLPRQQSEGSVRTVQTVEDYADLQGSSLLKKTLGLQNHRYARYIGPTDVQDSAILGLRLYDNVRGESGSEHGSFRQVAPNRYFHQNRDAEHADHAQDLKDVDDIEDIVAPHGYALIRLYFRIVHPTFPILHKKVYLEKYGRSHREFSPPLLAAVYLLALNWWSYSTELANLSKPDVNELEDLALRALWRISRRAKLSTVQAGLLLSQISHISCWPLTSLVVGIAQDLGLHLDCTNWRIPSWERGLRKRLAWAVFMQDTWSAMIYGRPPHLSLSSWGPQVVVSSDFPESAADEDDEDGSTEVEKGRTLFSAMIALTRILYEVLENMYSLRAEGEVSNARNSVEVALAQAKPIQLKLRTWYAQMPDSLQIDSPTKVGKLDSVGYLHLAYYATEMSIHRKVIRCVSHRTDPYLIQVCRTAAKSRLTSAVEFFDRLKPEHLQSFWYFASNFNLALIGTFAGLCMITSVNQEEAKYYQERLQKYRWTLRVWSNGLSFLKQVGDIMASAVEPLAMFSSSIAHSTAMDNGGSLMFPLVQNHREDDEDEEEDSFNGFFNQAAISQFFKRSVETDGFLDDTQMHTI